MSTHPFQTYSSLRRKHIFLLLLLILFFLSLLRFISFDSEVYLKNATNSLPDLFLKWHSQESPFEVAFRKIYQHDPCMIQAFDLLRMEDENIWRKRNRSITRPMLEGMSQCAFKAGFTGIDQFNYQLETQLDGQTFRKYRRSPIVVLGTAGTGTRVVDKILAQAGVAMSRIVNSQKDSKVFINFVKNHPKFGLPNFQGEWTESQLPYLNVSAAIDDEALAAEAETLMDWIQLTGKLDYELSDVGGTLFYEPLRRAVDDFKVILELEILARSTESEDQKLWGFKEPQAIFMLPYLLNAWRSHDSQLIVIHVVRDGRDIAFSKQQRKKYQNYYVEKLYRQTAYFHSQNDVPEEWTYATAVAAAWELVNLALKKWAERHHEDVRYLIVHLEDLCNPDENEKVVSNLLQHLEIQLTQPDLQNILFQTIDVERCHVAKYKERDEVFVRHIEKTIGDGLTTFGYLQSAQTSVPVFPHDLVMKMEEVRLNLAFEKKYCMITFVNDQYLELFLNFLIHIEKVLPDEPVEPLMLVIPTTSLQLYRLLDRKFESPAFHRSSKFERNLFEILYKLQNRAVLVPYEAPPFQLLTNVTRNTTTFLNADIWRLRVQTARALLEKDWTVTVVDVDSLLKDNIHPILPPFPTDHPSKTLVHTGADDIKLEDVDIIASRGRFPYDLGSEWGQTLCMGWIHFKPSHAVKQMMKNTQELVEVLHDDQSALNHALAETWTFKWQPVFLSSLEWSAENATLGIGQDKHSDENQPISIVVLPFSLIPRYCKDVIKAHRDQQLQGTEDLSDSNILSRAFPHAMMVHCYTPKSGQDKKYWFQKWGLWNVPM